jgi:hypothetical protein
MNEQRARMIVSERNVNTCEGCGRRGESFAHRVRRSQGGPWTPSNGLRLCGSGTTGCHGRSGHEPVLAKALGWELRPDQAADLELEPTLIRPVMLWLAWWRLDDQGGYTWVRDPDAAEPEAFRRITGTS